MRVREILARPELLIPARDVDGKLWSIQTIDQPTGEKRFMKGGRKAGLMHLIDPENRIGEKPAKKLFSRNLTAGTIFIAEGYATAATIHETTNRPAVVAFDAGNLKPVAEAIHKKYPKAEIIIAADNDHKLEGKPMGNVGLNKAREAAQAVGGLMIAPVLDDRQKKIGVSDWNDLAKEKPIYATLVEQDGVMNLIWVRQ